MAWRLLITDGAKEFIRANVSKERVLEKIEDSMGLLAEYPGAGPAYMPSYAAALPPFPCRYFPVSDTPFTLYYVLDEDAETVTVIDIEWSAGDPKKRFNRFLER